MSSVRSTGKNASMPSPKSSTQRSYTSCGVQERSRQKRWFLAALWTISPFGERTNSVLKYRFGITSGQRALHWTTM